MKKYKKIKMAVLFSLGLGLCTPTITMALPQGGVIAGGSGSIAASGSAMNVAQQTQNLFINWDVFSIGKDEEVQFTGPQNFAVLNRVVGHDASKIYGKINANNNGNVYLINPNGILIGDDAVINTGSFIASTKDFTDVQSFINTGKVNFLGDAQGNIVNLGAIKADHIEMHGDTISLKAADVNRNFNADKITIVANAVHAGVNAGETTEAVDKKLGVISDAYELKDSMEAIRDAVDKDKWRQDGHFMLSQDDLKEETWIGKAPVLLSEQAIDGLGYTVGYKTITTGSESTGIFRYISGKVKVDNFTFDHMTVTNDSKNSAGTGILTGWLDGDGIRVANVTVSNSSVTGYNYVGGLIGYTDRLIEGNTFLNVHNVNTTVTGRVEKISDDTYSGIGIGGIFGYEESFRNREGKTNIFRNVSNSGTITGRLYVGGLAGRLTAADMDEVRNTGRIEQKIAKNDNNRYNESHYIGGIAGAIGPTNEAAANVHIRNAYNGGTIGGFASAEEAYDYPEYIGGIVGMLSGGDDDHIYGAQDTVIEYAHNAGTITTGYENVGGLVGYATGLGKNNPDNASDMIIRHSFNDGEINAKYGGGLAGIFGGTIEQCYNNGAVNGWGSAGLVAKTDDSDLHNDVVIRDSYNTKNGTASKAGIIGNISNRDTAITLERVWNEANIEGDCSCIGGIIGHAEASSITMSQVYNFGKVQGQEYDDVGGLIGHLSPSDNSTITIKNSANYGDVTSEDGAAGGFIGETSSRAYTVSIENGANFGKISGNNYIGGLVGYYAPEGSGKLSIKNSNNYGTATAATDGKTAGGMVGYIVWDGKLADLSAVSFNASGTVGDTAVGAVGAAKYNADDPKTEFAVNFGAETGLTDIPDQTAYANAQFLTWKNTTTVDTEGKLGTETSGYPDGGYVWKMYETGEKDSDGNTLYYKPLLTAFQTKVATQKNSVEATATDVSGALYDVTLPDGQQIQGVDWQQVLKLQNQFTHVNNRGDGTSETDYTASDKETGGSVPDHLYGYYNSSQQGLNIFITPETVKPDEPPTPEPPTPEPPTPEPPTPDKPDLPHREVSRNDYLYSDEHDTGDGKLNWYMHMPPVIYIKDGGVQIEK